MTESLTLAPLRLKPTSITLPGSKSISNRCLLLASLAENDCELINLLDSDDTRYMKNALLQLGVKLETKTTNSLLVQGQHGNFTNKHTELFLGNAGTAFRPLTAVLALQYGEYLLSGTERMHQRPIEDLVNALRQIGAEIEYLGTAGYPPLKISPLILNQNRRIQIKANVSSQFLTALLIALPLLKQNITIEVIGDLISKPYIDITLNLLQQFGITIRHQNYQLFYIPDNCHYLSPAKLFIEGDASGASYFLAAGFLSGIPVTIHGVGLNSIQGDITFAHELEKLGATLKWGENQLTITRDSSQKISPFELDANHIPDAAMTLCIIALAAEGTSTIYNIASWRVKETDRIEAMKTELEKLGAKVTTTLDSISITPPQHIKQNVAINTYDDHRMAMCFALVAVLGNRIIINDPQCVNKTFPDYFNLLNSLQI